MLPYANRALIPQEHIDILTGVVGFREKLLFLWISPELVFIQAPKICRNLYWSTSYNENNWATIAREGKGILTDCWPQIHLYTSRGEWLSYRLGVSMISTSSSPAIAYFLERNVRWKSVATHFPHVTELKPMIITCWKIFSHWDRATAS